MNGSCEPIPIVLLLFCYVGPKHSVPYDEHAGVVAVAWRAMVHTVGHWGKCPQVIYVSNSPINLLHIVGIFTVTFSTYNARIIVMVTFPSYVRNSFITFGFKDNVPIIRAQVIISPCISNALNKSEISPPSDDISSPESSAARPSTIIVIFPCNIFSTLTGASSDTT